jgi:hypothetical protein
MHKGKLQIKYNLAFNSLWKGYKKECFFLFRKIYYTTLDNCIYCTYIEPRKKSLTTKCYSLSLFHPQNQSEESILNGYTYWSNLIYPESLVNNLL